MNKNHWAYTEKRDEVIKKVSVGWANLERHPFKKNGKMVICPICGTSRYRKLSHIKMGIKNCSRKCSDIAKRGKIPANLKLAQAKSPFQKGHICLFKANGKDHWNWKGGITPINKAIRASLDYEDWRKKVFERDLYTCQNCGQIGGKLEADHIKPFCDFPELRFEVSNGRTLCCECHDIIGWNLFRARNPRQKLV